MKLPKKPTGRGRRPKADIEARVELVVAALSKGYNTSQIKKALRAQGVKPARTCMAYIARARARLLAECGLRIEDHRAEALAFYRSVLRSDTSSERGRILARERMDKILGLEAPNRTELSGPNGAPVQVADEVSLDHLSTETLRKLVRLADELPPK